VLSFPDALAEVLAQARRVAAPVERDRVALKDADGRVLAEPISADRDQPPFDRSTRDGYAVRAVELSSGAQLRVIGSLRAGERWDSVPLASGEALEIMTGAPVPAGADAVAMLEHVTRSGEALTAQPGRAGRRCGHPCRACAWSGRDCRRSYGRSRGAERLREAEGVHHRDRR
jgi:molybdopterin molybdotransferase